MELLNIVQNKALERQLLWLSQYYKAKTMDKKHVILYVDDEPTNLLLFKIHFQKKYTVLTGNSGSDGLALLHSNPEVVVVVSDMKMPGMNGIEIIKAAKYAVSFYAAVNVSTNWIWKTRFYKFV